MRHVALADSLTIQIVMTINTGESVITSIQQYNLYVCCLTNMMEFSSFLRLNGTVDKNIMNKASRVSKLRKYLSSLQTATSEVPPTAEAKLLTNASHQLL